MNAGAPRLCGGGSEMLVDRHSARPVEDALRRAHVIGGAVCDDDELIGLERRLVLEDAVFGYTDAVKACAERRQTPDDGAFCEGANDPADQRAQHHEEPDARDEKKGGAEQHAPEGAPERTPLAPPFHAIAGIVKADDVLFGLVILADNRQLLHVEASVLEGA